MLNYVCVYVCSGQDGEGILCVWQADLLELGDASKFWWYSCDGDGLARVGWGGESFFLLAADFKKAGFIKDKTYLCHPVIWTFFS